MPFYDFDQNNSGGSFVHNRERGIGYRVVIEADNEDHANARAEEIGIYFDDNYDYDCECCGTRWSRAWITCDPEQVEGGWSIPSYIHYLDGRVVEVPCG